MEAKDMYHFLRIRKRPWHIWLMRLVWLVWLIFWAEVTWGSWKELEPRAAIISLSILVFSFAVGILIWFWGRLRQKKAT